MNDITADTAMNKPGIGPTEGESSTIGNDTFTPEQLQQMKEWAQEDGHLPEESTGETVEATEQPEFDLSAPHTDIYGQEVRGMDYKFPPPAPGSESMDLTEQQSVMAAFAAEGIPADLGAEFANVWNKHVSKPVDAEAYELSRAQSVAQLE